MTRKQKLLIEQSEKRQKINELLDKEDRSADENTELESLTARMQAIEPELRAAIVAEGAAETRDRLDFGNDTAGRELRALVADASAGAIFSATLEHRATDGRTAELQQHFGLAPNQVPLAMLRSPVEARAVTPAPGDVGTNQSAHRARRVPAKLRCLSRHRYADRGRGRGRVSGSDDRTPLSACRPRTPSRAAPALDTEGATTGSIYRRRAVARPVASRVLLLAARTARASPIWTRRSGMNLGDALSDKLDQQILNGTEGLLNGTVLANHNVSAVTSYATLSRASSDMAALTEFTPRALATFGSSCGSAPSLATWPGSSARTTRATMPPSKTSWT